MKIRYSKSVIAYAILALLALQPVAAMAKPMTIYLNPNRTADDFKVDSEACQKAGSDAMKQVAAVQNPNNNPSVAAAGGFMQGLMEGRAYNKAYEACFLGKGYILSDLSPEDEKAFKKIKKEDRPAWVHDYYARRIAEMPKPDPVVMPTPTEAVKPTDSSAPAAN